MTQLASHKLMRYAFVGFTTLAIYLFVGVALDRAGVMILWLAPIAFSAAVTVNYILQKMWVFKDRRPVISSLPKFFVMTLVGFITNSVILGVAVSQLPLVLAQLLAASVVVLSNALFSFLWVFSTKEKSMIPDDF